MTIEINPVASAEHTQAQNAAWYDGRVDRNLMRKPERFIHLFTISKREFVINRPPLHPMVKVPACGPNERYKLFMHVEDPFTQAVQNTENGRLRGEAHDGLRVAIDLINPNNITNNLDWEVPDEYKGLVSTGYGCDLAAQGLFYSLSEVPEEAEIKRAEARRHNYYDNLRRNAVLLERTNPKELAIAVESNKDYHLMADYFNLETEWHKKFTAYMVCPNCQDKIPEGAAFHRIPEGLCINDWKRVVAAGLRKREDVPEDARWWSEPASNLQGSKRHGGSQA